MPTLEGVVERITFHNEETGYTVAKLARDDTNQEVAVVGNMLGVSAGEHVRLEGEWAEARRSALGSMCRSLAGLVKTGSASIEFASSETASCQSASVA